MGPWLREKLSPAEILEIRRHLRMLAKIAKGRGLKGAPKGGLARIATHYGISKEYLRLLRNSDRRRSVISPHSPRLKKRSPKR